MKSETPDYTATPVAGKPARREGWIFLLGLVVFALLVYRSLLVPGQVHFTTDDNIGAVALRARLLPEGFVRGWDDSVLAGRMELLNLSWTNLLLTVLPVKLFHNLIHGLDLVIASFAFGLFLRERKLGWWPAALGALVCCWFGSTFFLNYAGHIGKFGAVMFACLAAWQIERAARRRSLASGALAGAALGAMFLEQPDVALFFGMVLGPYALFATWREHGWRIGAWLRVVGPVAVLAMVIAFRAIWLARSFFSMDGTADAPPADPHEVWSYCTQWSWPPEETLEWIAPGYMGWRSGEPEGPYWGRLGRSEGWEQTRQGFGNFKLETLYLGAIPVVLAAFAVWLVLARRRGPRADTVFWLAAVVVTFVLGLGKFTPLYSLFFEVPGISSIRGPVKFMQVAQFALAVLAAFGLDQLLRLAALPARERPAARTLALFERSVWVLGALLLLWSMALAASSAAAVATTAQAGWGDAARVIVDNRIRALAHGGVLLLAAGGLVAFLLRTTTPLFAARAAMAAVALVAADQLLISRHYVKAAPEAGLISSNGAVEYLKANSGQQRSFLANPSSFYGQWLSILFPYHGVATFNVSQIRMPQDYEQFLQAVGQDVGRLWQYFAVGHVLGPAGIWPQLQEGPFKGRFEMGYAYNVAGRGAGVDVVPGSPSRPGQHVIVRQTGTAPRFALFGSWTGLDPEATLARLRDPSTQPLATTFVPPAVAAGLPVPAAAGLVGSVSVEQAEAGVLRLKVATEQAAVLRCSDKFSPYWKAEINGRAVDTFRCDYLFLGVAVPPGVHTITLEHRLPPVTLWVQLAGLLAAAVALLAALRGGARAA